jgi:IS30 family transposase
VFIDLRPVIIGQKQEIWHFEVDFIESVKWDSTVILTLIDKCSRKKYAYLLPDRKSDRVFKILISAIQDNSIESMTFDNDNGFAKHYKLWISTYFCHTYSSREKWQVENGNRGYRKFFPKKTILKNISQEDLDVATNYLNNLPMKCLSYLTPDEYYNQKLSILNTNLSLTKKVVQ